MIQEQQKLVQITIPSEAVKSAIKRLDTDEGRNELSALLLRDIDEWCAKAFDDGPRSHLGASLIGDKCDRHIWYSFRWFKHFIHSGRMQRLFQRGHYEEDFVIRYLRGIGCSVEQVSEAGEQIRIYAVDNHFGGSSDGSTTLPARYELPDRFLIEIKTVKDGNYDKVKDVRKDNVKHWRQMCVYGYKRGLKYAVYFFSNKDDDRLFIQVVELDFELAARLITKADWLIHSNIPPARISNRVDWWECKQCDHYKLCQTREATPDLNCRTCVYAQPIQNGYWQCNMHRVVLTKDAQLLGCQSWTGLDY